MWNKKDFIAASLAATAAFGLTLAAFLPRVATATDSPKTHAVLSPVLHVSNCDIQAQSEGQEGPSDPFKSVGMGVAVSSVAAHPPGDVTIAAGKLPAIKITVKNTSDKQTTVSFVASDAVRGSIAAMSRLVPTAETKWTAPYDLTLKPGETREITADTGLSVGEGGASFLYLADPADNTSRIVALQFSTPAPIRAKAAITNAPAPGNLAVK